MIHVDAIEDALAVGDIRVVEAAFRGLVDFPSDEMIRGAKSVDGLCSLLARVTQALARDQTAMPPAICGIIAAAIVDPIDAAATYASGAKAVADHAYHWRGRYLQYAANGGKL